MEKRLRELDLLRGLSVIGMIFVITPGAWGAGYSLFNHADWEGLVAVDMIAPMFMFCIGFAIPLSLKNRIANTVSSAVIARQIVLRGSLLILLGLLIHLVPSFDFSSLRIPGVLQRIGLTYIAVSLIVLAVGRHGPTEFNPSIQQLAVITAGVLISAWLLFQFIPVPGFGAGQYSSDGSWSSYIDQQVFGVSHLWKFGQTNGAVTYDPDGLLCSYTTAASVLIGTIIGVMYQRESAYYQKTTLSMIGLGLIALGFAFSLVCPIIKKLYTSSFVLISSGVSVLVFVGFWSIKNSTIAKKLCHPFEAFGANALFGFVVSWLGLFWFLDVPIVGDVSLRALGFDFIASLVSSRALASLLFAVVFVAIMYALLATMLKKKWYVRL